MFAYPVRFRHLPPPSATFRHLPPPSATVRHLPPPSATFHHLPSPSTRYFAIMLDRATMGPLIIACSEGGTSIEDLAASSPEKIIKVPINIDEGITDAQARRGKREAAEASRKTREVRSGK